MATVDLLARDAIALAADSRAILGIAGSPGAGKSTLVDALVARIRAAMGDDWIAHVPMDGFHLADAQLDRIGARGRKGAADTFDAAGYAQLLERVKREIDDPVYVPGFDRALEQPLAAALVVLPTARLVVTEGNYLLLDDRHVLLRSDISFRASTETSTSLLFGSYNCSRRMLGETASRRDHGTPPPRKGKIAPYPSHVRAGRGGERNLTTCRLCCARPAGPRRRITAGFRNTSQREGSKSCA